MTAVDFRQRAGQTKARRTQASLVAAAEELFTEKGWHTSIEEIAERAKVGKATARNHFKTKKAILAEVYAPLVVGLREQLDADLAEVEPAMAIERLVRHLCQLARSRTNLTIAMLTAVREETVADDGSPDADLLRRHVRISAVMAACLRAGQDQGQFAPDLPVDDVASYHTNALLLRLFVDTDETAEQTAELVLSQLRPVLAQPRPQPSPAAG